MAKRLSENEKTKSKRILIIVAIILLLLIALFYIFFFRKQYTITFDSNGGSKIASVQVRRNGKIEKPDDPIKEGYIFAGWYYNDELYNFDLPVKKNMTLLAEWGIEENAEIEGIALDVTELTIAPDGTAILVATLLPENAKQIKLIWESSDKSIVTVDEKGDIKALKEGNAKITVSTEDRKFTATCEVKVSKEAVAVKGVSISGPKEVSIGETIKLTAKVTPDDATNKEVSWSSRNSNIARVDKNGNVIGIKEGTVTITVTTVDGAHKASYTVKVKANNKENTPSTPSTPNTPNNPTTPEPEEPSTVLADGLTITGPTSVYIDEKITLIATVSPSNATDKTVTWSSSDSTIATVDSATGVVTGKSAGSVTITAKTSNGITKTYQVAVQEKPATYSVVLTPFVQEGTGAVWQYSFVVYKNGTIFSEYKTVNIGGETTVRKGEDYISLKSRHTSATIILSDNSSVAATVTYN